jgi:antitoxin VapB
MKTAKLFKNGQSQAVRLPKEYRFDGTEVFIKKVGSAVVLLPEKNSWDPLVSSLERFTPEFMAEREQPRKKDKRESWD